MTRRTVPVSRRLFLATGAATLLAAPAVLAKGAARVVIVGGGAGGASVARMLATAPGIQVTLVEAKPVYTTCSSRTSIWAGCAALTACSSDMTACRAQGFR